MKRSSANNKMVSVIIPAYNAEAYISRCLDSILTQDYKEIEIIVIDDESSDKTRDIVRKYNKGDKRVALITQSHQGPNAARGRGIEFAHGDFIMFVDADDYIVEGAISKLIYAILSNKVDSVRYNALYECNGELVCPLLGVHNKIIKHKEIIELLAKTSCLNALCFQMYKADLVKRADAFKNDIAYGEDLLVNAEIHEKTSRMLLLDDALYCYCGNPKSTTHNESRSRSIRNISDRIFVSRKMISFINKNI